LGYSELERGLRNLAVTPQIHFNEEDFDSFTEVQL
jgi:hypothetical protein